MEENIIQIYDKYKSKLQDIFSHKRKAKKYQLIMHIGYWILILFIITIMLSGYFSSWLYWLLPDYLLNIGQLYDYESNSLLYIMWVSVIFATIVPVINKYFVQYQSKSLTSEKEVIEDLIQEFFSDIIIKWYKVIPEKDIKISKLFGKNIITKWFQSHWSLSLEIEGVEIAMDDLSSYNSRWIDVRNPYLMSIPVIGMLIMFYQFIIKSLSTKEINNPNETWKWSFCKIMFYQQTTQNVYVLDKTLEHSIQWAISGHLWENILLENNQFNNNFITYSNNQFDARYILSPLMMEKILAFKNMYKRSISLSFVDGVMYIVINNKWLLLFSQDKVIWLKALENFITDIQTIVDIVKIFNLTNNKEKYNKESIS